MRQPGTGEQRGNGSLLPRIGGATDFTSRRWKLCVKLSWTALLTRCTARQCMLPLHEGLLGTKPCLQHTALHSMCRKLVCTLPDMSHDCRRCSLRSVVVGGCGCWHFWRSASGWAASWRGWPRGPWRRGSRQPTLSVQSWGWAKRTSRSFQKRCALRQQSASAKNKC